jgi:hypothetical protein
MYMIDVHPRGIERQRPPSSTHRVLTLLFYSRIQSVIDPITRNRSLSRKTVRRRQGDTPKGNDVESNKYFENSDPTSNHCLRRNGTERAWFFTREEAERFAESPANPAYQGDVAHRCPKCGFYHLSRPEWLKPKFTPADLRMLEDAGIETPPRLDEYFRCAVCGSVMRDGFEFLIMPDGSVRCTKDCGRLPEA